MGYNSFYLFQVQMVLTYHWRYSSRRRVVTTFPHLLCWWTLLAEGVPSVFSVLTGTSGREFAIFQWRVFSSRGAVSWHLLFCAKDCWGSPNVLACGKSEWYRWLCASIRSSHNHNFDSSVTVKRFLCAFTPPVVRPSLIEKVDRGSLT